MSLDVERRCGVALMTQRAAHALAVAGRVSLRLSWREDGIFLSVALRLLLHAGERRSSRRIAKTPQSSESEAQTPARRHNHTVESYSCRALYSTHDTHATRELLHESYRHTAHHSPPSHANVEKMRCETLGWTAKSTARTIGMQAACERDAAREII